MQFRALDIDYDAEASILLTTSKTPIVCFRQNQYEISKLKRCTSSPVSVPPLAKLVSPTSVEFDKDLAETPPPDRSSRPADGDLQGRRILQSPPDTTVLDKDTSFEPPDWEPMDCSVDAQSPAALAPLQLTIIEHLYYQASVLRLSNQPWEEDLRKASRPPTTPKMRLFVTPTIPTIPPPYRVGPPRMRVVLEQLDDALCLNKPRVQDFSFNWLGFFRHNKGIFGRSFRRPQVHERAIVPYIPKTAPLHPIEFAIRLAHVALQLGLSAPVAPTSRKRKAVVVHPDSARSDGAEERPTQNTVSFREEDSVIAKDSKAVVSTTVPSSTLVQQPRARCSLSNEHADEDTSEKQADEDTSEKQADEDTSEKPHKRARLSKEEKAARKARKKLKREKKRKRAQPDEPVNANKSNISQTTNPRKVPRCVDPKIPRNGSATDRSFGMRLVTELRNQGSRIPPNSLRVAANNTNVSGQPRKGKPEQQGNVDCRPSFTTKQQQPPPAIPVSKHDIPAVSAGPSTNSGVVTSTGLPVIQTEQGRGMVASTQAWGRSRTNLAQPVVQRKPLVPPVAQALAQFGPMKAPRGVGTEFVGMPNTNLSSAPMVLSHSKSDTHPPVQHRNDHMQAATHQGHLHARRPPAVVHQYQSQFQQPEVDRVNILCSESFIEKWGSVVIPKLTHQQPFDDGSPFIFDVTDCSLVDKCGVDIELPRRAAVVIVPTGELENVDRCRQQVFNLAENAATGRYRTIMVVCVHAEGAGSNPEMVTKLLTATIFDQSKPDTTFLFKHATIGSLADSIRSSITGLLPSNLECRAKFKEIKEAACLPGIKERAKFLLAIVPVLSSCGAIECIMGLSRHENKNFRTVFVSKQYCQGIMLAATSKEDISEIHPQAMIQLARIVRATRGPS